MENTTSISKLTLRFFPVFLVNFYSKENWSSQTCKTIQSGTFEKRTSTCTSTCKFIYFSKTIKLKKIVVTFITENLEASVGCFLILYIIIPNWSNVPSLSKVLSAGILWGLSETLTFFWRWNKCFHYKYSNLKSDSNLYPCANKDII